MPHVIKGGIFFLTILMTGGFVFYANFIHEWFNQEGAHRITHVMFWVLWFNIVALVCIRALPDDNNGPPDPSASAPVTSNS